MSCYEPPVRPALQILGDYSALSVLHGPANLQSFLAFVVQEACNDLSFLRHTKAEDVKGVEAATKAALDKCIAGTGFPIDVEVRVSLLTQTLVLRFYSIQASLEIWNPEDPVYH